MTGAGERHRGFCRDCLAEAADDAARCGQCRSPRLLRHAELHDLRVAHLDCDAFYAAVEKRDNPALRDKPVIVGGERRGVVSTACYIARIKGVRSAMPMFKALKLCPEATVIKPNMEKYVAVGREVRAKLLSLTPSVEPLSIDEAFLDLTGTDRLHGHSAATSLAMLAREIERDIGITVSIGLSYNKFLAKVASDLEKPRGFSVIGKAESRDFLARQKVSLIWGVGKATQERLARAGITGIAQLQTREKSWLMREFGSIGARLYHLSRGEDVRHVEPDDESKSISAETTFNEDISDYKELERILWRMSERVSRRAKAEGMAGSTVVLKLKTADFKIRTRNVTLGEPTQLADRIFSAARPLLERETGSNRYRLLGVGLTHLTQAAHVPGVETLDAIAAARGKAELAMDRLREKFGRDAIERGLGFSKRGREEID
ncbi:MAG: DNA polymerase IV [Rhizobiales bacterium]|nr:DNA polymerase IV [Hyphomicrobiales bacterium]